jgi:hypothetical protein
MSFCRALSSKGNVVDYRPAVHHNLFKLDGVFDFRYSALRHCQAAVDKYLKQVLWGSHKSMFVKLVDGINSDRDVEKIGVSFIATGEALCVSSVTIFALINVASHQVSATATEQSWWT